jgi:hypothetical protein
MPIDKNFDAVANVSPAQRSPMIWKRSMRLLEIVSKTEGYQKVNKNNYILVEAILT